MLNPSQDVTILKVEAEIIPLQTKGFFQRQSTSLSVGNYKVPWPSLLMSCDCNQIQRWQYKVKIYEDSFQKLSGSYLSEVAS